MHAARLAAIAFATAIALPALAQESSEPIAYTAEQYRARAAQTLIFLPPDYPEAALAKKATAVVDVFGRVRADGMLEAARVEVKPANPDFEAAVRTAMPYWLFRPNYDAATCEPSPVEVQVRVWFELRDGQPTISLSVPKKVPHVEAKVLKRVGQWSIDYPREAIRRGVQGQVQTYVRVNAAGETEAVVIEPGAHHPWLAEATRQGLRKMKFEPRAGQGPVCASHTVQFNLR